MNIKVLKSSSDSICILLCIDGMNLLLDCGLYQEELQYLLQESGTSMSEVDAVLVTHEHSDHSRGLINFQTAEELPIISSAGTYEAIYKRWNLSLNWKVLNHGDLYVLDNVEIKTFSLSHDSFEPTGFIIKNKYETLGYISDTGEIPIDALDAIKSVNKLIIAGIYDENMLIESDQTNVHKERINSRNGHLSNQQVRQLLQLLEHDNLREIHLMHYHSSFNSKHRIIEALASLDSPLKHKVYTH